MTLFQLRAAIASYLGRASDALTGEDGVDLGLVALNQVRLLAELNHDFEFSRKLVTVSVDGVTGGSLDSAVVYGTSTVVEVKTVIDVGTFDVNGNLRPVEWSTVTEGLSRERAENPRFTPRIPTDAQAILGPYGQRRFVFSGNNVFFFPKSLGATFSIGLEAYTFTTDWVDADMDESSTVGAPWTTKGSQYLQWAAIVHLNNLFKEFVFRQEGNLPPPQTIADSGLEALKAWDVFKYEQFRRHGR